MRLTLWWSSPAGASRHAKARRPSISCEPAETAGRFSADGQLMVWMYDIDTINSADPRPVTGFYLVPRGSGPP